MRDPHDYEKLLKRLQLTCACGMVLVGGLLLLTGW